MKRSRILLATALATAIATFTACAPPEDEGDDATTKSGVKASEATSAEDFGGMDGLEKAAKKEGELNVIALPPTWANYGNIIKAFEDKYDIKVNSTIPDGASQDEINAAKQQKGKSTRPDVFDLGQSVALANTSMFAATRWRSSTRSRPSSRTRRVPGSTTTAGTCRSATTPRRSPRSPRSTTC